MIKSTKKYDMFIFRKDNRDKIDKSHVQVLVRSIERRNMLDLSPIIVNEKMEILNGQHRLLAAKQLGVEIFYEVQKGLDIYDVLCLNTVKSWSDRDYLNYFIQNGYEEYAKLKTFCDEYGCELSIALAITIGSTRKNHLEFREGRLAFDSSELLKVVSICQSTIDYIRKMNGVSVYTRSVRFWRAMIKIFNHPDFDVNVWNEALSRMVERLCCKATTKDYLESMLYIYNWKRLNKITFKDDEK